MENALSELLFKLRDRELLVSIFFGSLSLIFFGNIFGDCGFVRALGSYEMVPVFVLYFIFGGFVAHLFLKLLLWNRVRGQKNEFHSWLKNDAKEIEKKILKALLNERVLTVQQIAEKLCPGMTLQQIIGNEPHLLSNIQAVLYYLADEQIVHEKSLTRGEYPYSAYYLTKEYIAFLKEKESALSIFSNPAQSQPITAR